MDSINKLQQAYPQRYGTVNTKRFRILGIFLLIAGVVFVAVGGYAFLKTQQGYQSLNSFSAAQNVKLTYNDQGQLAKRGKTEGATAIMGLLKNDWGYTVDKSELNPNDPLVNTASEYMYQMATITYHTLHATTRRLPTTSWSTARSSPRPARTTSRTTASTGPVRPDQSDPGCRPRPGMDRHGARADR